MKVTCRLLNPSSFRDVRLEVIREYHRYVMYLHDCYAVCRTYSRVLLCFIPRRNYRIFVPLAVALSFIDGGNAVICVDALPRLPRGTACGVLVDPRVFLVVLATSLESLIL